jgi:hypothetical protein
VLDGPLTLPDCPELFFVRVRRRLIRLAVDVRKHLVELVLYGICELEWRFSHVNHEHDDAQAEDVGKLGVIAVHLACLVFQDLRCHVANGAAAFEQFSALQMIQIH